MWDADESNERVGLGEQPDDAGALRVLIADEVLLADALGLVLAAHGCSVKCVGSSELAGRGCDAGTAENERVSAPAERLGKGRRDVFANLLTGFFGCFGGQLAAGGGNVKGLDLLFV